MPAQKGDLIQYRREDSLRYYCPNNMYNKLVNTHLIKNTITGEVMVSLTEVPTQTYVCPNEKEAIKFQLKIEMGFKIGELKIENGKVIYTKK